MKLKKLVSAVVCAAMACVFAVSAFAATPKEQAQDYVNSLGLNYTVTDSDVTKLQEYYGKDQDAAKADAQKLLADAKADPSNAANLISSKLSAIGFDVVIDSFSVDPATGNISATFTINGQTVSASVYSDVAKDEHPDIAANKDENGNWSVDEGTAAAAATVTGGTAASGVIKATGDNSAVVLVAGVLVVASVLGLAVRKNRNIG